MEQITCRRCASTYKGTENFYKNKRAKNGYDTICKKCSSKMKDQARQLIKWKCVQYLGGECEVCKIVGTPTNGAIFDFHHKDPNEKEFNISTRRGTSFEVLKPELDKCQLLCSNCHRLEHAKIY